MTSPRAEGGYHRCHQPHRDPQWPYRPVPHCLPRAFCFLDGEKRIARLMAPHKHSSFIFNLSSYRNNLDIDRIILMHFNLTPVIDGLFVKAIFNNRK